MRAMRRGERVPVSRRSSSRHCLTWMESSSLGGREEELMGGELGWRGGHCETETGDGYGVGAPQQILSEGDAFKKVSEPSRAEPTMLC